MAEAPSRTAEYVALFRAIESARPPRQRLFSDPYAAGFLDPKLKMAAFASSVPGLRSRVPAFIDRRWPSSRPPVVVRTKLIDDAVEAGLNKGAEQLVILGAGYDTRGMRIPGAGEVSVFELDQPATQERKKRCLEGSLASLPPNITYVPFDLEDEGVGAPLSRGGFLSGKVTVGVWEGVVSYLSEDAVDATLRWFSGENAPGSRLVFTYIDLSGFGSVSGAEEGLPWKNVIAKAGEPFRFGLETAAVPAFLAERGLRLTWDVSTAEALAGRYPGRDLGSPPEFYRVALAEIPTATADAAGG